MIQRKQSLWLLIAALLNAGVFLFDLYRYDKSVLQPLLDKQVPVAHAEVLRVSNDFPLMILSLVMILLPLVALFMYKNRKQQIMMVYGAMLGVAAFIGMALMRVSSVKAGMVPGSESYRPGLVLPVVSIVFLILAIVGIRKDDKLVKSADRLR